MRLNKTNALQHNTFLVKTSPYPPFFLIIIVKILILKFKNMENIYKKLFGRLEVLSLKNMNLGMKSVY